MMWGQERQREKPNQKEQKMKSLKFFGLDLATILPIGAWRLVLLLATAVSLIGHPKPASAATVYVGVGVHIPLAGVLFWPLSVTIHPGDQVKWTWASSDHSTTSDNGIWDSGIRGEGATFTHTFDSVGTFPYHCIRGSEAGTVIVTPPTGPPILATNPAGFIASFSATLKGSLNPDGLSTTFHFQYGTTTSYGLTTAPQTQTGDTFRPVSANINSLAANTTYHFRIVASNTAGTRFGNDITFTTLPMTGFPVVTTNPATSVTASSARLNGTVDPHGLSTTFYFQYGTTTSYGSRTPNHIITGNNYQNFFAGISELTAGTTYHFRVVATNTVGTRYGNDRTFTTQ
jgi:plastocyanin